MVHWLLVVVLFQLNVFNSQSQKMGFETDLRENSVELKQLKYYELLKVRDMRRKVRSAIDGEMHVHFSAFNRSFNLLLTQSKHLIASKFRAFEVDGKGIKKPVGINYEEFFEGSLFGQLDNTIVSAHIDTSTGLMTAAIHDRSLNEVYFVEPYWRHSNASDAINEHQNSLLIYRSSDVRHSVNLSHNASVCESVHVAEPSTLFENDAKAMDLETKKRQKRSDDSGIKWNDHVLRNSRCTLILVADYLFYESVGAKDMKLTINYLIALIGRINVIFTETSFSDSDEDDEAYKDYGFTIQEIIVHKEPSHSDYYLYNTYNRSWTPIDLLSVFSREKYHESFCLAHLFTRRNFHPTLGMAYVASPKRDAIGGICSSPLYKPSYISYPKTGFTTTTNKFESQLTTSELDLVTAHELGHNWGALHDPDIKLCSPSYRNGGSYIMYYFSISGREKNNRYFSPCSRRAIKAVLKNKADYCFIKPSTAFCGNGVVEEGEECDAGFITTGAYDKCCTYDCKLRLTADCSDQNEPCCNRCKYVNSRVKCRDEHRLDCLSEAYCTGNSGQCPKSGYLDDGTDCLDHGKCVGGRCLPFCETRNLHSCVCENAADACKRCCSVSPLPNVTCIPYKEKKMLTDGTPCIRGYCERGICKHSGRDIAHRFWHIMQTRDVNAFASFMKDNIVGTVVLVSLAIWIPICFTIKNYDKRQLNEIKEKRAIRARDRQLRRENRALKRKTPERGNAGRSNFEIQVYQVPHDSDSDWL